MKTRVEHDFLGEMKIPANAYYGVQTMRTLEQLLGDLEQFRKHWLPTEEVQASGGHGTAFGPYCEEAGGYEPTYITGPKRALLQGQGRFLAPHGDMMIAGCFGLIWGWAHTRAGE